jgi:hypothetical protein
MQGGQDLLIDSERSSGQAAAPEASTTGFSSHVRRRRAGSAEQKERSTRRLQLRGEMCDNEERSDT